MNENLKEKILELKRQKNAIILAHYYQRPEVQEIADFIGDSYNLSKIAKENNADTIVFCGVKFMAESAKVLSPQKKVLLPQPKAGCPMADMADAEGLAALKAKHPNAKVVCYINSSVEVKALSDTCCTSSNAAKIVKRLEGDEIIFLPDKNLGSYVQEMVPEKNIILWNGFCKVHNMIIPTDIEEIKSKYGDMRILAHPECWKPVRDMADFIGSTGAMIDYAEKDTTSDKYLVVTETGIMYKIQERVPNKTFYPLNNMVCVNMKATHLEDVYNSLLNSTFEINIEEDLRLKALSSLENMLTLGR
ncbi:quinolinate synthase NadA [Clostridium felsineum]|uniref:Quinolinate synthase n=1 Tax=Clostridium felsineum TaxID=36839 RepID=A0A1S8LRF9_9CLOT|nr:quinolinate synthase NadA [Clostridium felsineum]URZ05822.1 Quinolinate synthase A [Clostridium felsineum]URZ10861.1 Quinolinate synthase A [Clostridium felsineum]